MKIKYTKPERRPLGMGGFREGSGRPKGSKNKVIPHIRELAREYTEVCIQELVRLALRAKSEQARNMAINQLMDRAWGKAPASVKLSGDIGITAKRITEDMTPEQAALEYANTIATNRDLDDGEIEGELAS